MRTFAPRASSPCPFGTLKAAREKKNARMCLYLYLEVHEWADLHRDVLDISSACAFVWKDIENSWLAGITALLTLETMLLSSSIFTIPTGTIPWPMSVCRIFGTESWIDTLAYVSGRTETNDCRRKWERKAYFCACKAHFVLLLLLL